MKGIQFFFVSMETAAKFVQPIPIFLAYLVPLEQIQNGVRCHGNQGTKWLPDKKIPRFGQNLVSK
jgi:hypothetical protein